MHAQLNPQLGILAAAALAVFAGIVAAVMFWPDGNDGPLVELTLARGHEIESGTTSRSEALSRAEDWLESTIPLPRAVPNGFHLAAVRAERSSSPIDRDTENLDRRWTDLTYRNEDGLAITITYLPGTRSISVVKYGWNYLEVPGVEGAFKQERGHALMTWNGPNGNFSALYDYGDESFASGAQDILIELLESVE